MTVRELETPRGPAKAHLRPVDDASAALVLGHGAAGGVEAPDIVAAAQVAGSQGITVALVEQPYRVAGRKSPPKADHLDEAWTAVIEQLVAEDLAGLPLIVGGRSLGARVACRTAAEIDPIAVLCLAFPLQPKRRSENPPPSRLPELDAVTVPTLVVQGTKDQFGMPPAGPQREVAQVPGNHSLRADVGAVAEAVRTWLSNVAPAGAIAR